MDASLPPAEKRSPSVRDTYRARPRRAGLDQITPPSRQRLRIAGSGLGGLRELRQPELLLELLQRPEARDALRLLARA